MEERSGQVVCRIIGILSGIITILDFSIKTIKNGTIYISRTVIIAFTVTVISMILYYLMKDVEIYYFIGKNLSYYTRKKDSYFVVSKECIYTYKSRTEMEYIKRHAIISNVNDLKTFCDKFKWSKEQKLEDINIVSDNNDHIVTVKRIENWHQYTVQFGELGKGQGENICIKLENLHDPEKESMTFLSSNVVCKTKLLKLAVFFKDDKLKPINIKYKIFDNYACEFPLIQRKVEYNSIEHKIEIEEDKPRYGYRYELSWDFEND